MEQKNIFEEVIVSSVLNFIRDIKLQIQETQRFQVGIKEKKKKTPNHTSRHIIVRLLKSKYMKLEKAVSEKLHVTEGK